MSRGSAIFSTGAGIVVGSVLGYLILALYGMARLMLNLNTDPAAMAWCVIGLLLGFIVMAIGWMIEDRQRQKGKRPHEQPRGRARG